MQTESFGLAVAREMLERAGIGFAVISRQGKVRYVSPVLAGLVGIDQQEAGVCAQGFERRLAEAAKQSPGGAWWAEDVRTPSPPVWEVRFRREDGESAWLRFRFGGEENGWRLFIAWDVTRQHRTSEALQASEESYRTIFNSVNDGIVVHLPETGEILDVNDAACRMFEMTKEEFSRRGFMAIGSASPYGPKEARAWFDRALQEPQFFEWRARSSKGKPFWADVHLRRTTIGGEIRILSVFRNITNRKRAESDLKQRHASLQQANRELAQLHRMRDEVLAMISHELRTPLVTGMGYLELLLEGALGPVSSEISRRMSVALRNLKRLAALIDDLLDYKRISNWGQRKPPALEPIDVKRLLTESRSELMIRRGVSAARIRCQLPAELPFVSGDPELLRMVLDNLLDNAVRYAGPDANITLSAERSRAGRVRVAVSDDGVGMDPAVQATVFDPFVRGSSGVDGTGLGLAIVKSSLEAIGSEAMLESAPGQGTTIAFELPVDVCEPKRSTRTQSAMGSLIRLGRAPATIAVIDDHRDTLEMLDFALSGRGYQVVGAASAQEAEALVRETAVDLILLDVALPDRSGTELCKELKQRASLAGVPIFIVTGRVDEVVRRAAREAGCDGYLTKPLVLEELIDAVDRALGARATSVAGHGG